MKLKTEIPNCDKCEQRHKSMFCDASDEIVDKISEHKGCSFYKKSQYVFNENTPASGLYCVYEGSLKIFKMGSDGKEVILKLVKAGDVVGYRALLANESYGATCAALEDSKVCFVPKTVFNNIICSSPDMMQKVMKLMSRDLKELEERFANWAHKPVRERLAEALILLNERFGNKNGVGAFQLALSREELANIVGTATETLIRCLSELKADKIIDYRGKEMSILNPSKLLRIANLS